MLAQTIDDVLDRLGAIIETAREERSPLGYFPALYRAVTAEVKQRMAEGGFDDNERMDRLDVIFANRYLDAYAGWRAGRPVSGSWRATFENAANSKPIIVQHLVAGMNAHINLDLAIASATTAPGAALAAMRADFLRINEILFAMIDVFERRIASVSPWMRVLDWVGGRNSDEIVRFSISGTRDLAWKHATELAATPQAQWAERIARMDTVVETLGRRIFRPGPLLRTGVWVVRRRETSDPRKVLDVMTR